MSVIIPIECYYDRQIIGVLGPRGCPELIPLFQGEAYPDKGADRRFRQPQHLEHKVPIQDNKISELQTQICAAFRGRAIPAVPQSVLLAAECTRLLVVPLGHAVPVLPDLLPGEYADCV